MTEPVTQYTLHISTNGRPDFQQDRLISDEITRILHWILFTVLCQAIVIFGIGNNIINIICFIKQGFQDPVNVSFVGLAVADLGCLTTLIWTNICQTPAFADLDLPFDPNEFSYLTSTWVHIAFSRVTAWITAIITLERCLCVTLPLQVRHIVTPRRMMLVIVSIFVLILITLAPIYLVNRLGMKFFPKKNKTLLGVVNTADRGLVEKITFPINTLLPFIAFLITIVSTITLVYKLRVNTKWRSASSQTSQATAVSNRNIAVAKMVTMIAALFIACFSPLGIIFIGMTLEHRLSFDGLYINTVTVLGGSCVVLESINSSANIFIYFHMSSNYRAVFRKLFGLDK